MLTNFIPLALGLAVISTTNVAIHNNMLLQPKTKNMQEVMTERYKTAYYSPILLDQNLIKQVYEKPTSLAENDKSLPNLSRS